MYQFSYAEVIDDSPGEMRARERQAMDKALELLRAAQGKAPGAREVVDALLYLRRLWTIFMQDLGSAENELPPQMRAGLISIGIWMHKEIDRVRLGKSSDLTAMIEINEIVRNGLT
jgi:flagellar biosynthesis activator protein FlaF